MFSQLPPKVTFFKAIVEYHNQDIDNDTVKIQNSSFTISIPHVAFYSHFYFPHVPISLFLATTSSVQFSHIWLFATPWTAACQASLSMNYHSLLKLMSIESVMASNHLILCCPLLLLPSICIRVFSDSQFFTSSGQSIGASASASVLNSQDGFSLGLIRLIFLKSKGLSRVFSNTGIQKHQFFDTQLSLRSNSNIHTWLLEKS